MALVRRRLAATAGLADTGPGAPAAARCWPARATPAAVATRVVREALGAEAAELLEASEQRSL